MTAILEKEIEITGTPLLKGTLALPGETNERLPAVLMIVGSGKIDRNGVVDKPKIDLRLYKQLAEFITGLGYITLRYDKRGVGGSEGEYLRTGMWDLVDDAKRAVQFLASRPEVDPNRIIVLGHSEGATLATALNAVRPVNGLVLLSGGGERLEEALQRQRNLAYEDMAQLGGFKGWLLRVLKAAEKSERNARKFTDRIKKSEEDVIKVSMVPVNAKWMREHFFYDVVKDLEKIECPVLAVTGKNDVQADTEKLSRVTELARGAAEIAAIDDMDHGLKLKVGKTDMLNYRKELPLVGPKPLHKEFTKTLEDWLNRHFPLNGEALQ
ncbi:alpha/beta hydrolase family protein [Paenibacillus thermotolerans]|uniref:alpha/beta hydrolase family protein n=1 Tax=Paenibacillus thermotolerans TaxID=3027807 RepID=UPI002367607E|nr:MULTISPECIES: alpha/beta fold hydrolase [unclassified Paenibacillus]